MSNQSPAAEVSPGVNLMLKVSTFTSNHGHELMDKIDVTVQMMDKTGTSLTSSPVQLSAADPARILPVPRATHTIVFTPTGPSKDIGTINDADRGRTFQCTAHMRLEVRGLIQDFTLKSTTYTYRDEDRGRNQFIGFGNPTGKYDFPYHLF